MTWARTCSVPLALLLLAASWSLGNCQAGGGSLRVVDSKGREVGVFYPPIYVFRNIDGSWFEFQFTSSGFSSNLGPFALYPTTDCSGAAYLQLDALFIVPLVIGGKVYYPKPPTQQLTIQSCALITDPTQPPPAGNCLSASDDCPLGSQFVGPLTTLDLSKLKVTPPFRISR